MKKLTQYFGMFVFFVLFASCKKDEAVVVPPKDLSLAETSLGKVLTDDKGKTLYFFSNDIAGGTQCTGNCLTNWPIYYKANPTLGAGLEASDFGTISRSDGAMQSTYKGWPLYYYVNDAATGDMKGENVNKVWFVAKPQYSLFVGNTQLVGNDGKNGNADAMWNKPEGTPKKLPRLGTNPEFARYGDLHAMNNASFLSFLKERAGKSSVDGAFLDRIAKGIGYNSFADVPESAISEVTFDKGTYGNLGWGAAHNTGFDELPDNERDRKAFKITGNGACSIHFMKTCGNHFVPFNQCN